MITPEMLDELQITAEFLMDDVIEFLMEDIIKTVKKAGQITSTAEYGLFIMKTLSTNPKTKEELKKKLRKAELDIDKILDKYAYNSYEKDLEKLGVEDLTFGENAELVQLVQGIKKASLDNFENLTGTMGFIGPSGSFNELTQAYWQAANFAYTATSTGAMSYDQAVKRATQGLLEKGIRTVDYESGITTEIGAAVRRDVISSVGNLTNSISEMNAEELGADGWEISAHWASAPDHEPIQGKQYTKEEFERIDEGLKRHIGTLNCGHIKFPIKIGKTKPVYTQEELKEMTRENQKGSVYEGKHYTTYEATQKQRQIERKIRKQKRMDYGYKLTGNKEDQAKSKQKLNSLYQLYNNFSKATNLKPQYNRF